MNNDDADSSRQNSNSLGIMALIVVLPLIYALSFGPVVVIFVKYPALKPMGGLSGPFMHP